MRAHDVRACACLCAQPALCEHSMVQTTCRGGDVGGDGHGMRPPPGDGQQLPAEHRIKRALPPSATAVPLTDTLPVGSVPIGRGVRGHTMHHYRASNAAADPPLIPQVGCCTVRVASLCARCNVVRCRSIGCARAIVATAAAVGGLLLVVRCSVCATIVACCFLSCVADRLPAEDCAARVDDLHRVRAAVGRVPRRRHCVLSVGLAAQAATRHEQRVRL